MKFRSGYMPSIKSTLDCSTDQVMTEQCHKQECDINNILNKYQRTGIIEHRNEHQPEYGFATAQDFQNSMEIISKAQSMFEDLPSSLRNKFDNNPSKFLDFVQNPDNKEELITLGLAKRPPAPAAEEPQAPPAPVVPAEQTTP